MCYARPMKNVLLLEKRVGETPLECLNRFRAAHPEYAEVPMTYAGRLDPMANGLLLVLAGDLVHRKDDFLGLDKEYRATVVFGVSTDTYDGLGKIQDTNIHSSPKVTKGHSKNKIEGSKTDAYEGEMHFFAGIPEGWLRPTGSEKNALARSKAGSAEDMEKILESFVGTFEQCYPPYSSKTIDGVQMHQLARSGELDGKDIPKRTVTVYRADGVETAAISRSEIAADLIDRIGRVTGDFRQDAIRAAWQAWQAEDPNRMMSVVSFRTAVSSGTYIRSIVHELGKRLGVGAVLWKLTRVRIGDFILENKDF